MLSVRDFGAVGDGRTDDAPAIQATIDAVETASSRSEAFLPTGTYGIKSMVRLGANGTRAAADLGGECGAYLKWLGDPGGTMLEFNSTAGHLRHVLRDFGLDGTNRATGLRIVKGFTTAGLAERLWFMRCQGAIEASGCWESALRDTTVYACTAGPSGAIVSLDAFNSGLVDRLYIGASSGGPLLRVSGNDAEVRHLVCEDNSAVGEAAVIWQGHLGRLAVARFETNPGKVQGDACCIKVVGSLGTSIEAVSHYTPPGDMPQQHAVVWIADGGQCAVRLIWAAGRGHRAVAVRVSGSGQHSIDVPTLVRGAGVSAVQWAS